LGVGHGDNYSNMEKSVLFRKHEGGQQPQKFVAPVKNEVVETHKYFGRTVNIDGATASYAAKHLRRV
jgi:hypothetical protein